MIDTGVYYSIKPTRDDGTTTIVFVKTTNDLFSDIAFTYGMIAGILMESNFDLSFPSWARMIVKAEERVIRDILDRHGKRLVERLK